ncbi:MAG TPA: thioester domain-containing protein [Enteractinococcus helveticum]|uniref:Thioester domain-containing protein n=1 Tax=Enteractinococcus helveticum TaxID=1837282 RepID=A0A921FP86_9MICC|nr:thioester domain-containing protein [Enteractinococcus helveticum]HJF15400.1 thioester domain-containing protein [Enteractinococcus helveticum]
MKHTLLASLATVTLSMSAALGAAPAQANPSEEIEHEIQAVMGPEQEYQRGLTVNDVAPILRSVIVDGEAILAYCIEYWVRAASADHQAQVTGWDGFTGDNHFKTNPQVREAVAWILHNSYPALSLDELEERTSSTALTEPEAIAATQAAIWFYTDDFVADGNLTVEPAPGDAASLTETSAENVQKIFDYLTGEENTGLTEQEAQASVTLTDARTADTSVPEAVLESKTSPADQILGPVIINSSSDYVNLQLETTTDVSQYDVTLLDPQGQRIDVTTPVAVEELWVHVPADVRSGSVQLIAESTEYGYTGRLIIPEPAPDRRFQTIVVVDQTSDSATTDLALRWEQPEPAEPPATTPPKETEEEAPQDDDVIVQPSAPPTPKVTNTPEPEQHNRQSNTVNVAVEKTTQTPAPSQTAVDDIAVEETVRADEAPAEELAETGAHQTRNVLVALGTIALGGIMILVNRLRRRWA